MPVWIIYAGLGALGIYLMYAKRTMFAVAGFAALGYFLYKQYKG